MFLVEYKFAALEFGHRWGWLAFALCVFGLFFWTRRWTRRVREERKVQVSSLAARRILFALTLTLFGFLLAPPCQWVWAGGPAIAGAFTGLCVGWREARRREVQLESEGKLVSAVSLGAAWSSPGSKRRAVYLLAAYLVLCFGETLNWWPAVFLTTLAPGTMALIGAFFLTASAYMWLWAKRKERHGLSPLLIIIRKG